MKMSRGWLHLASGAGIGRVSGFLSNLLLSRLLGPAELGLFNLVTTTVQTSDTLVRCGADYALNYELGGKSEAIRTDRGIELAGAFTQICSLTTALICSGFVIWTWFGNPIIPSSLPTTQRWIFSGIVLLMIACEGSSVSAWETLLVSHRTAFLALRQGLFFPLRILLAVAFSPFAGVMGAMSGWCIAALLQCFWLRSVLDHLWNPFQIWPILWHRINQLLRRGATFYGTNLLSTIIFYPLLLNVATSSGLVEIGYLRAGQILQQLFAFLPATLVPVLFLKLRGQPTFASQAVGIEKPFRIVWFILLEVLLIYCLIDKFLIYWIFGSDFTSALFPTRLLLLTALFECLSQIVVQPVLASGQTRLYAFWQNIPSLIAALLGWIWIPMSGLSAFLIVRLIYVIIPLLGLGITVSRRFEEPHKFIPIGLVSISLIALFTGQILNPSFPSFLLPLACFTCSVSLIFLCRDDVSFSWRVLINIV